MASEKRKSDELTRQLQDLLNRRAELTEIESLALALKYIEEAGIPAQTVDYFTTANEIAMSQNSDIKTVSEDFLRTVKTKDKGKDESKTEKERLRKMQEEIRCLEMIKVHLRDPAGVY